MPTSSGGFGGGVQQQCTAISKRSGERCKGPAVIGSSTQKCRMHGGKAQYGLAAANFQSGRHSKYLPSQMADLYQEALNNPDILEMVDHIALLEARIHKVLDDNITGDPVPDWGEVKDMFMSIYALILTGDLDLARAQCEMVNSSLEIGCKWDRTWREVVGYMEQLRKMTDTEVKRKRDLNQMIPVERVMILVTAVADSVKRNVSDPDERFKIHKELAELIGSNGGVGAGASKIKRVGPAIPEIPPQRLKREAEAAAAEAESESAEAD
jgi:hypothetical protein